MFIAGYSLDETTFFHSQTNDDNDSEMRSQFDLHQILMNGIELEIEFETVVDPAFCYDKCLDPLLAVDVGRESTNRVHSTLAVHVHSNLAVHVHEELAVYAYSDLTVYMDRNLVVDVEVEMENLAFCYLARGAS